MKLVEKVVSDYSFGMWFFFRYNICIVKCCFILVLHCDNNIDHSFIVEVSGFISAVEQEDKAEVYIQWYYEGAKDAC